MIYSIVDIETTGGVAANSGITEIAIINHDGSNVVGQFHSLVNPGHSIPSFIVSLTGINNAMVASAPSFEEIADDVYEMLRHSIFVAHNVSFDFSFVNHQLKQSGYILSDQKLCTVRLSRKVFPGFESYSLGKLCRSLDIEIENRHRAMGDAMATTILFEKLLNAGATEHINKMLKRYI
jgi:DNA polymerase-3 subunit epsilon